METVLHLAWEGPFSVSELSELNDPDKDIGIYQIYAHHPVYGYSLVYIGKATGRREEKNDRTFCARIKEEKWNTGSENDPQQVAIYVGRLTGQTPQLAVWRKQIDLAEKLLIHSHAPAYNSVNVFNAVALTDCGDVRVVNWGACRSLCREVSGMVWTARGIKFRDEQQPYHASAMPSESR
jgi:hypothetical protein